MKLTVVIPVGPGHEQYSKAAKQSVLDAARRSKGPFDSLAIAVISDDEGKLGRSAARNKGVRDHPSDWYFFLDADDEMLPDALRFVCLGHLATFGAVCLDGSISVGNVYPVTRKILFERGARGTLSMGCFVRGDVAEATPFDESLDAGEDFDFYMRLPGFIKIREPLVSIGYRKDSAGGPRGYKEIQWTEICGRVIDRYR